MMGWWVTVILLLQINGEDAQAPIPNYGRDKKFNNLFI